MSERAKVRVGHVLGSLNFGGVEAAAKQVIRGLAKDRFEPLVWYIGQQLEGRVQEFTDIGREFHHCPYVPPYRLDFVRRLVAQFRAYRPDVVIAYSFGNHAMVSLAARLGGVPRAWVHVAGSPLRDRSTWSKSLVLSHFARPFCDGEIAISQQLGKELVRGLRLPRRRVCVIEDSCAVSDFEQRAAVSRAKRSPAEDPILLMVARMDDAKDHPTLIQALAMLIREGVPLRLRLAGDGPRRFYHEELCRNEGISSAVEFLGARTDIAELQGQSDISLLITHTEGFGIVLIEAMASGTPVIATDIPVIREVLSDGNCGVLVPPRDPLALAKAIRHLLTHPEEREKLVRAAFDKVRRVYDVKTMVAKYAAMLGEAEFLTN